MKTIDRTTKPITLDEMFDLASNDNEIVRNSEGGEFVVAESDDFDQEVALIREIRRY